MDDLIFVVETGDVAEMLERVGLEDGGVAQKQLDESFVKYCDPYVPVGDSMVLLDSAYRSTEFGSGEIVWNTPYAHYMYEGILFVDPETGKGAFYSPDYGFWSRLGVQKIPSNRELEYRGGGLRGKKWAERMWADRSEDIIREVEMVMGRKSK